MQEQELGLSVLADPLNATSLPARYHAKTGIFALAGLQSA